MRSLSVEREGQPVRFGTGGGSIGECGVAWPVPLYAARRSLECENVEADSSFHAGNQSSRSRCSPDPEHRHRVGRLEALRRRCCAPSCVRRMGGRETVRRFRGKEARGNGGQRHGTHPDGAVCCQWQAHECYPRPFEQGARRPICISPLRGLRQLVHSIQQRPLLRFQFPVARIKPVQFHRVALQLLLHPLALARLLVITGQIVDAIHRGR